ncbi:hypothetical protein QBC37DRAFT_465101 [Rhypophila decipiens]|uniref:Ankyrin repeat domain-containing protein n=1 Tax=Rhypophila decipiens TaxID=261697 RepID=A0AAN6Y7J2_9PEZI|nr:hypothetical protein QBC37DRAFT_465101 [Rhypophila decipiens]
MCILCRARGKTMYFTVKALHLATRDLAEILLSYGAKVNAVGESGRTPLGCACGLGGHPSDLGDTASPGEAYALASLLVSHGAKLTREGQRLWPDFLSLLVELEPELEASFSEAFKNPGVVHGSTGKALVMKAKRLKDRVTKR